MNDYLHALASMTLRQARVAKPRIGSLFEPVAAPPRDLGTTHVETEVGRDPAASTGATRGLHVDAAPLEGDRRLEPVAAQDPPSDAGGLSMPGDGTAIGGAPMVEAGRNDATRAAGSRAADERSAAMAGSRRGQREQASFGHRISDAVPPSQDLRPDTAGAQGREPVPDEASERAPRTGDEPIRPPATTLPATRTSAAFTGRVGGSMQGGSAGSGDRPASRAQGIEADAAMAASGNGAVQAAAPLAPTAKAASRDTEQADGQQVAAHSISATAGRGDPHVHPMTKTTSDARRLSRTDDSGPMQSRSISGFVAQHRASSPVSALAAPTIHVTIGRVEVRTAAPGPAPAWPARTPENPRRNSLERYLRDRAKGEGT
jgi:hypothetical protein